MKARKEIMEQQAVINNEIGRLDEKIQALQIECAELEKEALLLSDDTQQFTEKIEVIGSGKKKRDALIGRIHWKEDFKDEDTGEIITIERSQVVRVNGSWRVMMDYNNLICCNGLNIQSQAARIK